MNEDQHKTAWYHKLLTPQTFIYLMGGIVAVVVFWIRTKESWDKVKEIERQMFTKANVPDVKSMDEKINKQYILNREITDRMVEIEKWVEFHKGYEQARKDYGIKP